MPKQHKLDIDLGPELRAAVAAAANAAGESPSTHARRLIQQGLAESSSFQQAVADAVIAVAAAIEPDERFDPADDPRAEAAVLRLAALLGAASTFGGLAAAEGVATALAFVWTRWALPSKEKA